MVGSHGISGEKSTQSNIIEPETKLDETPKPIGLGVFEARKSAGRTKIRPAPDK